MGVKRRSPRWVPGLALLLLALALGDAQAAPRRIAVLNAATDGSAGGRAAAALRRALAVEQPELSPLAAGDLSRALEEALPAESEGDLALGQAAAQLDIAREAIARFEAAQARRALARAESVLLSLEPDARVVQLLAKVSFEAGLIHVREQNRGLAVDAFRQVRRLAPAHRALDPARYPPEVVQAFESAGADAGEPGWLEVSATFDGVPVYLDGVRVGATPFRGPVAAGPHVLLLAAPEFLPAGRKLDAAPRDRIALRIELDRVPVARRAAEMRRRLRASGGHEREDLRRAGRDVALMAGVDAVLVVSDPRRAAEVAVYERSSDRLSLFRPVDDRVNRLFGLLLPAAPPGPLDLVPEDERGRAAWYQRPWVVGSLSGGAVLTVLGVILLNTGQVEQNGRDGKVVGF